MFEAIHGIRNHYDNNSPVSEHVTPQTPSLEEKKFLSAIFTNPESVQEQMNHLQKFQILGDLFSDHLQYLLGGAREIFSRQQSVINEVKSTSERGQDRICTEGQTRSGSYHTNTNLNNNLQSGTTACTRYY